MVGFDQEAAATSSAVETTTRPTLNPQIPTGESTEEATCPLGCTCDAVVLLASPSRSFVAVAATEEAGECAAGTDEVGECINPDAVAQEEAGEPNETTSTPDEESDPKCPSLIHVIKCAGEYLDKNQNRLMKRSELQSAINKNPGGARVSSTF